MKSIGIIFPFLMWYLIVDELGYTPSPFIPRFYDTFCFLAEGFQSGEIVEQLISTGYRYFVGLLCGVLCGGILGITLSRVKACDDFLYGIIEFFRSLPVTALLPLILALCGLGDTSRILMTLLPAFLLTAVDMRTHIRNLSTRRSKMSQMFGANVLQTLCHVTIPELLPSFFGTLRLCVSLSLMVVVVSEMFVGATSGLGQRIYESYMIFAVEELYGYLFIVGLCGVVLNVVVDAVEWSLLSMERV